MTLVRALGVAAALCMFCVSAAEAAGPGTDAVRVAYAAPIDSLDPLMMIEGLPLFRSIFDALTDTGPDGSLQPRLAESWTASDNSRSWTFRIRAGATWSDNTPVTADDVVFTVDRILSTPTSLNHNYMAAVTAVTRTGVRDITFTLRRPIAAWPRQMTLISIVPRQAYTRLGPAGFAAHPVGSGPYRVSDWDRAGNLTLSANPGYWGARPDIATVTMVPLADSVARLNGLLAGEIDVIPLAPQQVPLASGRAHIEVETVRSNRVVYLGFNVNNALLHALPLRQAIDAAIDRAAITRYLLSGLARPSGILIAPATFGYDAALHPTAYDAAKARQLVTASGYKGQPIQLDYATDGTVPLGSQVAQAIGGYLEAAGIRIRLHGIDQRSLVASWITHKFPGLYIFSYAPSTMDAALVTGSLLGSGGARYFTDPRVDALEQAQQAEADPVKRARLFSELLGLSNSNLYYAPLFNDSYSFASRTDKVRFTPRADGYILAQDLHLSTP